MKACTFAFTALLCSAAQTVAAFSFGPYQSYAVGSRPDSVAVGDIDGDGRDDVALRTGFSDTGSENAYKLFVFFQRDDGTLAPPVRLGYGVEFTFQGSLALADLDRNGIDDIIVGHDAGITVFKGSRSRKLIGVKTAGPVTFLLSTTDADRDGHLDVIGPSWEGTTIYHGDGNGGIRKLSYLPTPGAGYEDARVGDLNSDGFDDLVIVGKYLYIYLHDRVSGFSAEPVIIQPDFDVMQIGGVAIGDFNDDGRNDVAVGRYAGSPTKISVYHQTMQNGGFGAPVDLATYGSPSELLSEDIDGNGRDDLLVSHKSSFTMGLYLQGDSGLQPEVTTATTNPRNPASIALGDINSDGCKDVAIASYLTGLVWLYGNDCQMRPDLGVAVGLTPTTAAIRLEHLSGTAALQQPLVQIDLTAERSGTLQTGTLPAGCALQGQTANTRRIECLVDTMAPSAVTTLIIPITAASSSLNLLTVSAQASTDTPERSLSNNQASETIELAQQPTSRR